MCALPICSRVAFARSALLALSLVAACTRLVAISGGAEPSKLNGPAVNLSPRSTRLVIALVRLLAYSRAAGLRATYRTPAATTAGQARLLTRSAIAATMAAGAETSGSAINTPAFCSGYRKGVEAGKSVSVRVDLGG